MKNFRFVDLFCGGGGSITGAINALHSAGIQYEGRCFNHWDLAIRTIQANHPECVPDYSAAVADIDHISPWSVFAEDSKRLDILWASPSCTHHSRAAGGVPKEEQLRSQPEYIIPFLRFTHCRRLYVENVEELLEWGPLLRKNTWYKGKLYKAGQPDPRRKGQLFNAWYRMLKSCGYKVEYQMLNAADYGAATKRRRLIVQAVDASRGEKIIWPEPTHVEEPGLLSASYRPWRSAAEIIDWSIPGKSIFGRKKPLCENTLRRIEAGIRKYWGAWAEPFLIVLRGTGKDQLDSTAVPLSAPLPTITAGGSHIALVSPIWMDQAHTQNDGVSGSVNDPLNTICCSRGTHAVVTPFLTRYNGGENRNHWISDPVPVIDCGNRYGLISPLIIPQQSAGSLKPCAGHPVPTIATSGAIGVVSPVVMDMSHPGDHADAARCRGGSDPMGTITTRNNWGVVMPFLAEYYGNGITHPVSEPVPVIPTHDKFGLIQGQILTLPDGQQFKLDITHRMLTAKELAAATGFPPDYIFVGKDDDAKKMIGNAVPPPLAEALYLSALSA